MLEPFLSLEAEVEKTNGDKKGWESVRWRTRKIEGDNRRMDCRLLETDRLYRRWWMRRIYPWEKNAKDDEEGRNHPSSVMNREGEMHIWPEWEKRIGKENSKVCEEQKRVTIENRWPHGMNPSRSESSPLCEQWIVFCTNRFFFKEKCMKHLLGSINF